MPCSRLQGLCARLVGLTVIAAASAAWADPVESLPFEATLSVREVVTFTLMPPCFAIGALTGSGTARPLGTVTAISQDCINPIGAFDPAAGSYQFTSTGTGLSMKASDGSLLFATYSGTLRHRPGQAHAVSGDFVITGGTGRFRQASGGGTLSGHEDISSLVLGVGQVVFSGRIVLAVGQR
jgi:hypothetical protein